MVLFDIIEKYKHSNKVAVMDEYDSITYKELYYNAILVGNEIRELLKEGGNIGIYMGNCAKYAIAYFAITYIGATIVPINILSTHDEIKYTINKSDIKVVLTNDFFAEREIKNTGVKVINICCLLKNKQNEKHSEVTILTSIKYSNYDSCIMVQTSGTTGYPKLAVLSHYNIITNAQKIVDFFDINENDISLIVLPIELSCNTSQFVTHLYKNASVFLYQGSFDAEKIISLINKHKITNICMVPPMLYLLHKYIGCNKLFLGSLRYISYSGAPMSEDLINRVKISIPNVEFIETYGMTEAGPRISNIRACEKINFPKSVGKPMDSVKIKIVDQENREVEKNCLGEIVISSPCIMMGYYKDDIATNEVIKNGWLYTGDIGKIDNEGYLYIVGRKKCVINYGGNKVSPEEIEAEICTLHFIKDVLVYSKPNKILGDIIVADIVFKDEHRNFDVLKAKKIIIDHCRKKLSWYKIPVKFRFVEVIPTTNGKKVRK